MRTDLPFARIDTYSLPVEGYYQSRLLPGGNVALPIRKGPRCQFHFVEEEITLGF